MPPSRRQFLRETLGTSVGLTLAATLPQAIRAREHGANDAIQIAIVGMGRQGRNHLGRILEMNGVRVVAVCDPDRAHLERARVLAREHGSELKTYVDYRDLLADESVDGVLLATPNHWHALMTIWACQAGKDVYVEKPVSHNLWESRRMVEAARKYNRVVQAGLQNRSDDGFRAAAEYIWSGALGPLQWVHGIWYRNRDPIGRVSGPQRIPDTVDFNLWTGPAPLRPLMRENLHYDWHWQWAEGNGEMGNTGPHQMDDCIWVMREKSLPRRFFSLGGRFNWNDDGETPNTHMIVLDFPEVPLVVEIRNLTHSLETDYMDNQRGVRMGNVFQCEGGAFVGGRGGGIVYDRAGNRVKKFPGDGGRTHVENWLDAMRRRDRGILRTEVEEGAYSADLIHLGNLAYRAGYGMSRKEWMAQGDFHEAPAAALADFGAHLERQGVDVENAPISCSPWMTYSPESGKFESEDANAAALANSLAAAQYREPFTVEAKV